MSNQLLDFPNQELLRVWQHHEVTGPVLEAQAVCVHRWTHRFAIELFPAVPMDVPEIECYVWTELLTQLRREVTECDGTHPNRQL